MMFPLGFTASTIIWKDMSSKRLSLSCGISLENWKIPHGHGRNSMNQNRCTSMRALTKKIIVRLLIFLLINMKL